MSAYVEQEDALFALSTVRETLMFAAQLRLGPEVPLEEKKRAVELVIADLGLVAAADTCVGNEVIRGISGGERKRVAIGMELLHDPKLIFMDEPTSGLDAFQALNVMTTLKHLARDKGRTVVASVHQPRSSIYALVDQLVLLSGGRLMYAGDGGAKCSAHFAALGAPVPRDFNPADHFLDAISVDFRSPTLEATTRARIETLYEGFAKTREGDADAETPWTALSTDTRFRDDARGHRARSQFWIPFKLLFFRTWREQTRDVSDAHHQVRDGNVFLFALRRGVPAHAARPDLHPGPHRDFVLPGDEPGVRKRHRHLEDHPAAAQGGVARARRALYTPLPYFLSTFLATLPLELARHHLRHGFVFHDCAKGGVFALPGVHRRDVTGELRGDRAGDVPQRVLQLRGDGAQLAPFVILFLMFSGFSERATRPVFLIWLRELSFIRYAFQALCVNEFAGAEFTCDPNTTATCIDGDEHLERLKFDDVKIWENCLILFGMIVGFNALALAIIYYRQPKYLALGAGIQHRIRASPSSEEGERRPRR